MKKILKDYTARKKDIKIHLQTFKNKTNSEELKEFIFCILTPQSKAENCWEAVELLSKQKSYADIVYLLKSRVRFHNTKSKRLLTALLIWPRIKSALNTKDRVSLRDWIAETVQGYGLKEAGHFLRNVGYSDNKIAILDRHILRNLKENGAISVEKVKGKKDYRNLEEKALIFSKKSKIPIDELDLLFWHKEHGKYFK